ncbi:MAG: copper chaperone [Microbacteriaceae bacterium]|jgi:copper chaperone CopZ|nr:copper chaperone [Microbacteriaceae bacterium]
MCSPTTGNDLGLTDKNHACSCGTDNHAETATVISQDAIREHYLVDGMTCSHCVSSVTEEVSAIDGVESVKVALNAGGTSRIMVVSSKPIDTEAIRGAVTEAGYSLVSA